MNKVLKQAEKYLQTAIKLANKDKIAKEKARQDVELGGGLVLLGEDKANRAWEV